MLFRSRKPFPFATHISMQLYTCPTAYILEVRAAEPGSAQHWLAARRDLRLALLLSSLNFILPISPHIMTEDLSIPKTNTSYILNGIKDTAFVERPIPQEVGPNECVVGPGCRGRARNADSASTLTSAIIAPKKTGLCGT